MKKAIISTLVISILILGGSSAAIAVRSNAKENNNPVFVATETELSQGSKPVITPKNETVYAITGTDGTINKTFVNNTLNTSTDGLPVTVKISYYLDGVEKKASEIAGLTGHVKVKFSYFVHKFYNGKLIPFVAITGIKLDESKFSNIKLTNGKVVSEDEGILAVGYGVVGLNENLKTELLPCTFTIEADTTGFEFGETYTVATNELISDLDTSKLSKVDEVISSINQLANGMNQLVTGSSALSSGASRLYNGISQLQDGAARLNTGAHELAMGAGQVAEGVKKVAEINDNIFGGVFEAVDKFEEKVNEIASEYNISEEAVEQFLAYAKEFSGPVGEAYDKLVEYTDGVKQLADGAEKVAEGASQLADGTNELVVGVQQLKNGAAQLSGGASALNSGLLLFRQSGIDRLTSFANNDLSDFMNNFRASVEAARSYKYYQNSGSKSVKFVFKTESVKRS